MNTSMAETSLVRDAMPDSRYRQTLTIKEIFVTIISEIYYNPTLNSMRSVLWRLMQYGTTKAVWERAI